MLGKTNKVRSKKQTKEQAIKAWIKTKAIPYEDYKHLQSITAKDYTKGVVK